jgi:hypothetical protein
MFDNLRKLTLIASNIVLLAGYVCGCFLAVTNNMFLFMVSGTLEIKLCSKEERAMKYCM